MFETLMLRANFVANVKGQIRILRLGIYSTYDEFRHVFIDRHRRRFDSMANLYIIIMIRKQCIIILYHLAHGPDWSVFLFVDKLHIEDGSSFI